MSAGLSHMPYAILRLEVAVARQRNRFHEAVDDGGAECGVRLVSSSSPYEFLGMGVEEVLGHVPVSSSAAGCFLRMQVEAMSSMLEEHRAHATCS